MINDKELLNENNLLIGLDKSFFKRRLRTACEEGILLFFKYGLLLILILIALNYASSIIAGANNGTNAVMYLNELQHKGYLPPVVNGSVPEKNNEKINP